jgi:hypothetical protein
MNWNFLDTVYGPMNKILNLFFIFLFVLLSFAYQSSFNSRINVWGHFGGLLVGFFTLFIILKPIRENDGVCCKYQIWRLISTFTVGGFVFMGFPIFYLFGK